MLHCLKHQEGVQGPERLKCHLRYQEHLPPTATAPPPISTPLSRSLCCPAEQQRVLDAGAMSGSGLFSLDHLTSSVETLSLFCQDRPRCTSSHSSPPPCMQRGRSGHRASPNSPSVCYRILDSFWPIRENREKGSTSRLTVKETGTLKDTCCLTQVPIPSASSTWAAPDPGMKAGRLAVAMTSHPHSRGAPLSAGHFSEDQFHSL